MGLLRCFSAAALIVMRLAENVKSREWGTAQSLQLVTVSLAWLQRSHNLS
jgi:hypothetical protein